jgi:molybdopterin synthase catalytic subunit
MSSVPLLTREPIDVETLELGIRDKEHGAVVTFQGVVRQDETDDGLIDYLHYEAYEAMAENELRRLMWEIATRWPQARLVIQHRLGRVNVGETSVFIAVSSPHRAQAFEACRHAIDQVKTNVPIWKKDVYTNGRSQWTTCHHETMLLADSSITLQQS